MIKRKEKAAHISHLTHIFQHITWRNIIRTKLVVVGLAGLKMLGAKFVVSGLLVGSVIFNPALFFGPSSTEAAAQGSQYGLCGNGLVEFGERCDGSITCELPCECEENFVMCDSSCVPVTKGCSDTQTGSTQQEPACSPGEERLCATSKEAPCQGGSQKCIDGQRSACQPLNKSPERCSDGLDNDCDDKIDEQDPDCQPGEPAIAGCTDQSACNYDPDAQVNDGSCIDPMGCNDRCPGDSGEPLREDSCGVCGGDETTCPDCAGVEGGRHVIDKCGQCLLPSDPDFNGCATTKEAFILRTQTVDANNQAQANDQVTTLNGCKYCAENLQLDYIDITASEDDRYKACRENGTVAACLDELGVALTDDSYELFMKLRCELIGDPNDPDCIKQDFATQTVEDASQEDGSLNQNTNGEQINDSPPTKGKQRALFEACLHRVEHAKDCAWALREGFTRDQTNE